MTTRAWMLAGIAGLAACEGEPLVELAITLDPAGTLTSVSVPARARVAISGVAPGGLVDFEVNCHPPNDTDTVGFKFTVVAPALKVPTNAPARAGYFRTRVAVAAGPFTVELNTDGGAARCELRATPAPKACGALSVFRSVNVDHTHVAATSIPTSWEAFPASGDHYPIWAPWNRSYDLPIRTGYLLHDLEHGGLVLSFGCVNALQSAECTQAQADLESLRAPFASKRTNDTPDPTQPMLYAARAWRWGIVAECFDRQELGDFMAVHFNQGREDVDGDYGAPFDPTQ